MFTKLLTNTYVRFISFTILTTFAFTVLVYDLLRVVNSEAVLVDSLPEPTQAIQLSKSEDIVRLCGLRFDPKNPLKFDFIFEKPQGTKETQMRYLRENLISYFLTALTVPNDQLWVNLSPYEQNRILEDRLESTQLGIDMLAQDYLLKQLSSSITHPETPLGKVYWNSVGTTFMTSKFNKIWISADTADVYFGNNSIMLGETRMKVQSEKDYLASKLNTDQETMAQVDESSINDQIIKKIEVDVNSGANFAKLRQIYNAVLLADVFKKLLKKHWLVKNYGDKKSLASLDTISSEIKESIYQNYVKSFEKGVYDLIQKKELNGDTKSVRYFSGGITPVGANVSASAMNYFTAKTNMQYENSRVVIKQYEKVKEDELDTMLSFTRQLIGFYPRVLVNETYEELINKGESVMEGEISSLFNVKAPLFKKNLVAHSVDEDKFISLRNKSLQNKSYNRVVKEGHFIITDNVEDLLLSSNNTAQCTLAVLKGKKDGRDVNFVGHFTPRQIHLLPSFVKLLSKNYGMENISGFLQTDRGYEFEHNINYMLNMVNSDSAYDLKAPLKKHTLRKSRIPFLPSHQVTDTIINNKGVLEVNYKVNSWGDLENESYRVRNVHALSWRQIEDEDLNKTAVDIIKKVQFPQHEIEWKEPNYRNLPPGLFAEAFKFKKIMLGEAQSSSINNVDQGDDYASSSVKSWGLYSDDTVVAVRNKWFGRAKEANEINLGRVPLNMAGTDRIVKARYLDKNYVFRTSRKAKLDFDKMKNAILLLKKHSDKTGRNYILDNPRYFVDVETGIFKSKKRRGILTEVYSDTLTLDDYLKSYDSENNPLTEIEVLELLESIYEALTWIHNAGVAHNDLTLSNMQFRQGKLYISDLSELAPMAGNWFEELSTNALERDGVQHIVRKIYSKLNFENYSDTHEIIQSIINGVDITRKFTSENAFDYEKKILKHIKKTLANKNAAKQDSANVLTADWINNVAEVSKYNLGSRSGTIQFLGPERKGKMSTVRKCIYDGKTYWAKSSSEYNKFIIEPQLDLYNYVNGLKDGEEIKKVLKLPSKFLVRANSDETKMVLTEEFPKGQTLTAYWFSKERTVEDLIDKILDMTKVVALLEKNGIYHWDLKPEHFMLSEGGNFLFDTDLSFSDFNAFKERYKGFSMGTKGFIAKGRENHDFYDDPSAYEVFSLGASMAYLVLEPLGQFTDFRLDNIAHIRDNEILPEPLKELLDLTIGREDSLVKTSQRFYDKLAKIKSTLTQEELSRVFEYKEYDAQLKADKADSKLKDSFDKIISIARDGYDLLFMTATYRQVKKWNKINNTKQQLTYDIKDSSIVPITQTVNAYGTEHGSVALYFDKDWVALNVFNRNDAMSDVLFTLSASLKNLGKEEYEAFNFKFIFDKENDFLELHMPKSVFLENKSKFGKLNKDNYRVIDDGNDHVITMYIKFDKNTSSSAVKKWIKNVKIDNSILPWKHRGLKFMGETRHGALVSRAKVMYDGIKKWAKFSKYPERFVEPLLNVHNFISELPDAKRIKERVNLPDTFLELDIENSSEPIKMVLMNELPKGMTMAKKLMRKLHSSEEILDIIDEVLETMVLLESYGIYHGDIKLENIWLADDGRVIVYDCDTMHYTHKQYKERDLLETGTKVYKKVVKVTGKPSLSYSYGEVYALTKTLLYAMNFYNKVYAYKNDTIEHLLAENTNIEPALRDVLLDVMNFKILKLEELQDRLAEIRRKEPVAISANSIYGDRKGGIDLKLNIDEVMTYINEFELPETCSSGLYKEQETDGFSFQIINSKDTDDIKIHLLT